MSKTLLQIQYEQEEFEINSAINTLKNMKLKEAEKMAVKHTDVTFYDNQLSLNKPKKLTINKSKN